MRPGGVADPIWLRIIVAIPFLGIFLGSYAVPRMRDNIVNLVGLAIFPAAAWLTYLLYLNAFRDEYVSAYFVLTFASALVFESRQLFFIYSGWCLALVMPAILLVEQSNFAPQAFLALAVASFLVTNLALGTQLRRRNRLMRGLDTSRVIQEAAIESSRDAILIVNPKGSYLKSNKAFRELWNLPLETLEQDLQDDLFRMAVQQLKDPEALRTFIARTEMVIEEGEVVELEMVNERFIEAYWMPLRSESETIGRLWIFHDITQRKRVEQRLKASEKRLRMHNEQLMEFAGSQAMVSGNRDEVFEEITRVSAELLDVETASIWFFDMEKREMACQKLFRRSTGEFEAGVIVPMAAHEAYFEAVENTRALIVNDTSLDPTTQGFREGRYTGHASALIHARIRTAGKTVGVVSLEHNSGPRRWSLEDQTYAASMADMVAVSIEAVERKKAQSELENSLAVLQAIFDLSETGIVVEDNDHGVLAYNELYLKIWNMTSVFIENQPYDVLVQHCLNQLSDTKSITQGLDKIKQRPGMEYAGIIEFKDGKIVERYSKAVVVGGEIVGRCWFYLDITERKQKENELINRNFELDSFVYRASHDLKAPLNSIMGLINIIESEKEVDTILQYIAMMGKSVKKLDEFIRQLTQFSQDARLKVVRQQIHFQEMLEDILGDLAYMDKAGRMAISLNVQQREAFFSDPIRLTIVLTNIISNAIKYQDTKKEYPFLKIDVAANNGQAHLSFEDNGLGIDQEHLEKVFDLFFRASIQATGSGLGLYITHNAVKKLGGDIDVQSALGKGTTFTLTIPNRLLSEEEE